METNNLFAAVPDNHEDELVETILQTAGCRIERILSCGHRSPDGFWYDQDDMEWVILLKGRAGLRFEGRNNVILLQPGDYLRIDAHARHRVEWTDRETVWLAVHVADRDHP